MRSASGVRAGGGRLALDPTAFDAHALVARFGSPLYVYDLDVVTRRVAALRAALPPVVTLAYAVKANPSLAVVAHLGSLGLGADVASAGELALVRRAGIDPSRIVMTGPGKGATELDAALAAPVGTVTVESLGELDRLERGAARDRRRARVLLRAAGGSAGAGETVRIIGDAGAGKFGMDEADLRAAARHAAASQHLELLGLHRFGASNVTDARLLIDHVASTVELARDVLGAAGVPVRLVDLGGGLGIPYADGEPALDVAALGEGIARLAATWSGWDVADLRLLLEPGRWLVGPAGVYLATVVDRKRVGAAEVAVLDGGINHVLRPALVRQAHRLAVVHAPPSGVLARRPVATATLTVAGPLCTGLDVLGAGLALPVPDVGDLVAVRDTGAYGFTESMPLFLSHPTPAEVVLRGGTAHLARRRIEPAEWLAAERLPADATPVAEA